MADHKKTDDPLSDESGCSSALVKLKPLEWLNGIGAVEAVAKTPFGTYEVGVDRNGLYRGWFRKRHSVGESRFQIEAAKEECLRHYRMQALLLFGDVVYADPGVPLSQFTWLDDARFVHDSDGGHIEFAGKVFRADKSV